MGSAGGSARMRLLDVVVLDRRAVTSLSGETRGGVSENTWARSQERGRIHTCSSHAQRLLESSKLFSFRETESVYTCRR